MAADEVRVLKLDGGVIRGALDTLDETATASEASHGQDDVRDTDRYSYRVRAMTIEFANAAGGWAKHIVPSRNISRGGLSVLMNHFVYSNTRCRVHLLSLHNHAQPVNATVVRCRYLPGSGRLHEIGIKFDKPIDIALFHRGASYHRILIVDDDKGIHQILPRMLNTLNCDITSAFNGEEGVKAAMASSFDVILMDMEMPTLDGVEATRELRNRGYSRPIVALTAHTDEATKVKCLEAGFTLVATKPFTRDGLVALIRSLTSEPLVSSMLHDRTMIPMIDHFVRELPDRIHDLERHFIEKDLNSVESVARHVKGSAGTHGFEPISYAAGQLEAAVQQKLPAEELRSRLNEVAKLCFAARPVTCTEQDDRDARRRPKS